MALAEGGQRGIVLLGVLHQRVDQLALRLVHRHDHQRALGLLGRVTAHGLDDRLRLTRIEARRVERVVHRVEVDAVALALRAGMREQHQIRSRRTPGC